MYLIGELELLSVVDAVNGELSLGDVPVRIEVHDDHRMSISERAQNAAMKLSPVVLDGQVEKELLLEGRLEVRVDLVEDVVASLSSSLTNDTRLLEQVCERSKINLGRSKTTHSARCLLQRAFRKRRSGFG